MATPALYSPASGALKKRANMKQVEAQLGFNFKSGLSRDTRAKKTLPTSKLLAGIGRINATFGSLSFSEARVSQDLKHAVEDLFDDVGPELWPDFDQINGKVPAWLLQPARPNLENNRLCHMYPRCLFFSDEHDYSILLSHFQDMVYQKVSRYHDNHSNEQQAQSTPSDLEQDDDFIEINTSDDDASEDYSPSTSESGIRDDLCMTPGFDVPLCPGGVAPTAPMIPPPQHMGNTQIDSATSSGDAQGSSNTSVPCGKLKAIPRRDRMAQEQSDDVVVHSPAWTPDARSRSPATKMSKVKQSSLIRSNDSPDRDSKRKTAGQSGKAIAKKSKHMQEYSGEATETAPVPSLQRPDLLSTTPSTQQPNHSRSFRDSFIDESIPRNYSSRAVNQGSSNRATPSLAAKQFTDDTVQISPRPGYTTVNLPAAPAGNSRGEHIHASAASMCPNKKQVNSSSDRLDGLNGDSDFHRVPGHIGTKDLTRSEYGKSSSVDDRSPAEKTSKHDPTAAAEALLSKIWLNLYIGEETAPDEPDGLTTLADLTTKDKLFAEARDSLEDKLAVDDTIHMIRVKRADGESFKGINVLSMPITRSGKQDMWNALVQKILEHGVGDGGLRGYVKVKKAAGSR